MRAACIAAILVASCLSGCGSFAVFEPDSTGALGDATDVSRPPSVPASIPVAVHTVATTGGVPANGAPNSLFASAVASQSQTATAEPAAAGPVLVAGDVVPSGAAPHPDVPPIVPRGRAYLFRGVAGLIYSRGIDELEARIKQLGIPATIDSYSDWHDDAEAAVRAYRRDPEPIVLIGHSFGGDAVIDFADYLNAANIPVSLLVTYDPSRFTFTVPANVKRFINLYLTNNIVGGGNVEPGPGFHGHYASFNLSDHSELVHINIEKAARIQEQLVAKIAELAATPADADGEAIPLHYIVPANAPIELWDSGMPILAHNGDTLQTIAAAYHVPLWSLSEINAIPAHRALAEGQRVVVPRHLVPMSAAVASYAPNGQNGH